MHCNILLHSSWKQLLTWRAVTQFITPIYLQVCTRPVTLISRYANAPATMKVIASHRHPGVNITMTPAASMLWTQTVTPRCYTAAALEVPSWVVNVTQMRTEKRLQWQVVMWQLSVFTVLVVVSVLIAMSAVAPYCVCNRSRCVQSRLKIEIRTPLHTI